MQLSEEYREIVMNHLSAMSRELWERGTIHAHCSIYATLIMSYCIKFVTTSRNPDGQMNLKVKTAVIL